MSGIDNEVFNTLERAESVDVNDLQSLAARFLSDMARYGLSQKRVADPLAETVGSFVLGGLLVTPNGNDVSVSAGVMGQLSATLPPAPGPLDSPYRLSRNAGATTVVMPAPGATTFYLIEAQMVEVTTSSALRDIWTPPAGPFVPNLVPKQRERQIVFQLLTGGAQAPAPTGGDWVPIAIVRRPGGGGPVAASDIIDVRPLVDGRRSPVVAIERCSLVTQTVFPALSTASVRVLATGPGGTRAAIATSVDLSSASVLSPSTVLAAVQPYYLYLAPWSALSLAPRQFGTLQFEGVLVLSGVVPSVSGLNSGLLDLPAPYGVTQAPIGSAYYLGTFIRDSLNTGWLGMTKEGSDTVFGDSYAGVLSAAFSPPVVGDNALPAVATYAPATARTLLMRVRWLGAAAAPAAISARFQAPATSDDLALMTMDDYVHQSAQIDVPYPGAGLDFTVAGVVNAGTTATVKIKGWRE